MKKNLLVLFILACFAISYVNAQKQLEKIPYKLDDDFETGELFGWEPYPYAEDIGSSRLFFTQKTPTHNGSQYAAATLMRANDAVELFQGFTKRLNLWTTSETRVRVAVYFLSDRNPSELELSLGTFDGRLYLDTIHNLKANQWIELDIPVSAFRLRGQSLASGEHIQVVTLKATYPTVYWLNSYTTLIDDFMINGERECHFIGKDPASTDCDMFGISVLDKHFFYGDNISLSVVPESNLPLLQVQATLIDGKGQVVKDNIPFNQQDGEWINKSIYQLKEGDAAGQWEIKLTGQTARGTEVRWGMKFLNAG